MTEFSAVKFDRFLSEHSTKPLFVWGSLLCLKQIKYEYSYHKHKRLSKFLHTLDMIVTRVLFPHKYVFWKNY